MSKLLPLPAVLTILCACGVQAADVPESLEERFRNWQLRYASIISKPTAEVSALTDIRKGVIDLDDEDRERSEKFILAELSEMQVAIEELRSGIRMPDVDTRIVHSIGVFPKDVSLQVVRIDGPRLVLVLGTVEAREELSINRSVKIPGDSLDGKRKPLFYCFLRNLPTAEMKQGETVQVTGVAFEVTELQRFGVNKVAYLKPVNVKPFIDSAKAAANKKKKTQTPQTVAERLVSIPHGSSDNGLFYFMGRKRMKIENELDVPLDEFEIVSINASHMGHLIDTDLKGVELFQELESVNLSTTSVRGSGLKHLEGLPKLREIDVSQSPLDDEGFSHLSAVPSLKKIRVSRSLVTDEGLAAIAELPILEFLDVSYNHITDKGLEHLREMKTLKTLVLAETNVTDEGLNQLHGLKNLTVLNVRGAKTTIVGLREFRNSLPNCKIIYK